MKHITTELYFNSMKECVKGNRNNNNPVILFIVVCNDANGFLEKISFRLLYHSFLPNFNVSLIYKSPF